MDRAEVQSLLEAVAAGGVDPSAAADRLASGPLAGFADLGFARVDTHRALRTGDPEVVYAAGKTPEQTVEILRALAQQTDRAVLATRCSAETLDLIGATFPSAAVSASAGTAVLGTPPAPRGLVTVVAAGTSDLAVADEAAVTAAVFGASVERVTDVGVAGIHRLLAARDALDRADCLVVVAGMEGALPSAVGGLVGTPVVAVPTSVGYGAAFGGVAALLGMLTSCAPGVVVCNIDNGFGAGVFAARVARQSVGAA